MPDCKTYKQTNSIVSMKQQINIEEVHAKNNRRNGQEHDKIAKIIFPIFEIRENKLPRKRPRR